MRQSELKRKTPLKAGKPLARTEWKRRRPKQKKSRPKLKRDNEFPEIVKAAVRRRSGNRCEMQSSVCTGRAVHFHHRKLRRFGDNREVNCLHACTACHDFAHLHRVLAELMGWIVRSTQDPAKVPVRKGDAA